MKKLLFVFILFAGFSLNTEAQTLNYVVYNASLDTWNLTLDDANSPPIVEAGIVPNSSRSGTIGGGGAVFTPFQEAQFLVSLLIGQQ